MVNRIIAAVAATLAIAGALAVAQDGSASGPYKVLRTERVGGEGGFDYVYADSDGRRLYVPRSGPSKRISVFNLDTLQPVAEIPGVGAHGVAVDPNSHHGFASSKPVAMWDTNTMKVTKSIDVQGNPDGILFDPSNERVYILSHSSPNVTVIDGKDGSIIGTLDLGGEPEESASDGNGHLYIDLEDKGMVAVVDTKELRVTARYSLGGAEGPAGLAFDAKNGILFVECRKPAKSVIMKARDGKIIETLPIGSGVDGAGFMPETNEAFSSQGDGTLTIIKESSPSTFEVEQTLKTMPSAKTLTFDKKTGHVLLIAAEFGKPPAAVPGERPRRGPMAPNSFTILEVGK